MFREESLWIKSAVLKVLPSQERNEVANIGSSTEHFRKIIQPHIHQNIIDTLHLSGWKVINVDIKKDVGVDLIADVTKDDFADQFQNSFTLTICTNLLEHVEDINLVIENLVKITSTGGYILITVPYKYKIHLDPIDNGFRPTPHKIIDLFDGVVDKIIDAQIITITDLNQYRIKPSRFPFWGYRERFTYYLGKRHKTSGVLFSIKK